MNDTAEDSPLANATTRWMVHSLCTHSRNFGRARLRRAPSMLSSVFQLALRASPCAVALVPIPMSSRFPAVTLEIPCRDE